MSAGGMNERPRRRAAKPEHGEEAAVLPSREEWEERRPIVGCDRSTIGAEARATPDVPAGSLSAQCAPCR